MSLFMVLGFVIANSVLQEPLDLYSKLHDVAPEDKAAFDRFANYGVPAEVVAKVDRRPLESSLVDCFVELPDYLALDLQLDETEKKNVNSLLAMRSANRKQNIKKVYGELSKTSLMESDVLFASKRLLELESKAEDELAEKLQEELDPNQIDKVVRFIIKRKGIMFGKINLVANRLNLSIRQRKMIFDLHDEIVKACMTRLNEGTPNPSDLTSVREITIASNKILDSWNSEQLTAYAHAIGLVNLESSLLEHFEAASEADKERLARGFKFFRDLMEKR